MDSLAILDRRLTGCGTGHPLLTPPKRQQPEVAVGEGVTYQVGFPEGPPMQHSTRAGVIFAAVFLAATVSDADGSDLDYATIATLPCSRYLNAYGTESFESLNYPLTEYISQKDADSPPDKSLGSTINITSYMLTECRLNETYRIGEAVFSLFQKMKGSRLPRIPIGGATTDPKVHAEWDAFDKWIHHQGPRPLLKAD